VAVEKTDHYQQITDSIIAKLEAGVSPWAPGWAGARASRPLRSCGEAYRGINVILLWMQAIEAGYSSPFWMTYKQAEELGGQVKKGSKGSRIVFFSAFDKEVESADGSKETKSIPFLKTYCVFNAEQIEGLPARFYPTAEESAKLPESERLQAVQDWAIATGATIKEEGARAFYRKSDDSVTMPEFSRFVSADAWASTLAHELTHWTGHGSRLNRDLSGRFGDASYAMEELIAEMGAAFALADLGVSAVPRDDHASYLASWLAVLKADKRAIVTAAAAAGKAAEFLGQFIGEKIPAGV
jgi:antirestriction protein ArdC